jgi:hypothetical protein
MVLSSVEEMGGSGIQATPLRALVERTNYVPFAPLYSLCLTLHAFLSAIAFPNTDGDIDAKSGSDPTRRR